MSGRGGATGRIGALEAPMRQRRGPRAEIGDFYHLDLRFGAHVKFQKLHWLITGAVVRLYVAVFP